MQVYRLLSESNAPAAKAPGWEATDQSLSPICNFVVRDYYNNETVALSRALDGRPEYAGQACWSRSKQIPEITPKICRAECFKCSGTRCPLPDCEMCQPSHNEKGTRNPAVCPRKGSPGCFVEHPADEPCLCNPEMHLRRQALCKAPCYKCSGAPCTPKDCNTCGARDKCKNDGDCFSSPDRGQIGCLCI